MTAFDWGAYGELSAVGDLTDGRILDAKVEGMRPDEVVELLRLPKRDGDSHIGGKWKKDMEAASVSDGDDSEQTTGNTHDGDGLSAYEEYRGLIARGKHTRDHSPGRDGHKPLSPRRKDLIVHNTIGGKYAGAAGAGLDLFEKAAEIHVVEVDDGEMPDSRQVNVNRRTASAGAQYGLRLANEASQSASTAGRSTSIDFKRGQERVGPSPKYRAKLAVDIAQSKGLYTAQAELAAKGGVKMPYTAENDIAATIAHEMGHGVGTREHGPRPGASLPHGRTGNPTHGHALAARTTGALATVQFALAGLDPCGAKRRRRPAVPATAASASRQGPEHPRQLCCEVLLHRHAPQLRGKHGEGIRFHLDMRGVAGRHLPPEPGTQVGARGAESRSVSDA